jgi:hypothetical protein
MGALVIEEIVWVHRQVNLDEAHHQRLVVQQQAQVIFGQE